MKLKRFLKPLIALLLCLGVTGELCAESCHERQVLTSASGKNLIKLSNIISAYLRKDGWEAGVKVAAPLGLMIKRIFIDAKNLNKIETIIVTNGRKWPVLVAMLSPLGLFIIEREWNGAKQQAFLLRKDGELVCFDAHVATVEDLLLVYSAHDFTLGGTQYIDVPSVQNFEDKLGG